MARLKYVVRTIGERTEAVCIELLRRQKAPDEPLAIVREDTHAGAVERTLKEGLGADADWLVAVDADMVLFPDALARIRRELASCADSVFVVHPAVYDKLYNMRRWGVTVYRSSALPQLLERFLALKEERRLRIEADAIKALAAVRRGAVCFSRNVVALHDFYQYYRDLYRKAYLNALRNPGLNRRAARLWGRRARCDPDYRVLCQGARDALRERRPVRNSLADFTQAELAERIEALGLVEKPPLPWEAFLAQCLGEVLAGAVRDSERFRVFRDFFEPPPIRTWMRRARTLLSAAHGLR